MNQNVRVCFLSFFLTFLILFPFSIVIVDFTIDKIEPEAAEQASETMTYQPTKEEDLTILITVTELKSEPADIFCLARISPHDNSVSLAILPKETISTIGSKVGTLEELYDYGGINGAKEAVENLFFIDIDRTIQFDNQGLAAVIDYLGGVPFTLPETISFSENGKTITISEGRQLIDGSRFCLLLRSEYALPLIVSLGAQSLTYQIDFEELVSYIGENSSSTLTAYDAATHKAGWNQMIRMQNAALITPAIKTEQYQERQRFTNECKDSFKQAFG